MVRPYPRVPLDDSLKDLTAHMASRPSLTRLRNLPLRVWTGALLVLCGATLLLLFRNIEHTLPYPQHADEGFVSGPALRTVQTGNLHPYRFTYPSLPKYIAAAAMAAGFVRSAANLEIGEVQRIGEVGYPYYETPRVMQTARQAFALLAVMCVAMTGLSAWMAFRRPVTIVLAPLILLASPLFFRHSWLYLNVDIVAASFVMMALAACLLGIARPSIPQSALVPGSLAGLAIASKYTMALAALPVLLAIWLRFPRHRVISASFVAVAAIVAAFVAAVPYVLIDLPGFLNGVAEEAVHYASGHAGFAGEPGWRQLLYYLRHFVSEFGYGAGVLAVVGLFAFFRTDWRTAAVLMIFPAGLLWLLSTQRVNFTRNALAIHPFVAVFAAYGLVALHGWIVALAVRRGSTWTRVKVPVLAGIVLAIAAVPFVRLADHVRDRTDSRNLARAWIAAHLPNNHTIVVPRELAFDVRPLEMERRAVKRVELISAREPAVLDALLADVPAPAVILVPRWGADRRRPGQRDADALNALTKQWRVLETFGRNDVLVNYLHPTAWGDPAFSIAVLK